MLEKRKKFSKKQIKEDKLVTTYYQVYNYFLENQAKILIGLAVVAIIVVAVILFGNKKKTDNLKAEALLVKVIPLFEANSFKEAIEGQPSAKIVGLKNIVSEFGSTESGETAKIYLANSYAMLGKNNDAYDVYDSYSGSNPLYQASALAGMAGCLEAKNEFEKANDLYQKAAKISKANPANSEYLLSAGINLIKLGKKEEAKQIFEIIKKDYKTTSAFYELDRYLIQIEG